MKKYGILKQWKKVFAAVLSSSMLMTSVTPGTIVYASEFSSELSAETDEFTSGNDSVYEQFNNIEESTPVTETGNEEDEFAAEEENNSDDTTGETESATTIDLTSETQYIKTAGTYNINGCNLTGVTNKVLVIQNTTASDEIVLNIQGDITINDSVQIIDVQSDCKLIINGNGKTIENTGNSNVLTNQKATITFNNVNITDNNKLAVSNNSSGTIYVKGGKYKTEVGTVFSNLGNLYIEDGTITSEKSECAIDNSSSGKIFMTGGKIQAKGGAAIRTKYNATLKIKAGTIENSKYGIYLRSTSGTTNCVIGNVEFCNNMNDIYLAKNQKFTLGEEYSQTNVIKVGIADTISSTAKRQITTNGTIQNMLQKVVSANNKYLVKYNDNSGNGYLYLENHTHSWSYVLDPENTNVIKANCSDPDCKYYGDVLGLILDAQDMIYSGKTYDKASVTNDITDVTGVTAGEIYYEGVTPTVYEKSITPPTEVGTYKAIVKLNCEGDGITASKEFKIKEKDAATFIAPTAKELTYTGEQQELILSGNANGGFMYYRLGEDGEWQNETPKAENAGTYKVYYYVKGDNAHKDVGSESEPYGFAEVTIGQKSLTDDMISLDYAEKTYNGAEFTSTVSISDQTGKITSDDYKISGDVKGTKAGTYTISVEGKGNYAGKVEKIWKINPKEIAAVITPNGGIYGEIINPATVVLEGGIEGENLEIVLTYTGTANDGTKISQTETPSLAGIYTVTASVADKNYSLKEDGSTAQFIVERRKVTVKPENKEKYVNNADPDFTYKVYAGENEIAADSLTDIILTKEVKGGETGEEPGTYTITVSQKEGANPNYQISFETGKLTIKNYPIYNPSYPVTGITVSQKEATLTKEGETLQLTVTVTPSYADNTNVTWTSSNEKVATVDKNGKVTAVGNGTATITVTSVSGNYTATTVITVKISEEPTPTEPPSPVEIKKITLNTDNKTLTKVGDTTQITVKTEPENAENQKLIWTSSNEKVAVVDAKGKVTAVGTGKAVITVTTEDGKVSASVTITVKIPDEPTITATTGFGKLKLRSTKQNKNSITLDWTKTDSAQGYIIYGNYCNNNGKVYKYKKLATIADGNATGWTHKNLKKGTYYKYIVKAYKVVNGKKVITDTSASIHVITAGGKYGIAKAISVTKIGNKKNVSKVTLKKGKTAQIVAKEVKKDKTIRHHRKLCYESSNTKVATVTPDGVITAVGKGTCNIWVYAQNGVYQILTITIK